MSSPIKSLSFPEIYELTQRFGQPKYRAEQLIQWLFVKQARNYDEMTNLPKSFREELAASWPLIPAKLVERQISHDGTRKYCFELHDGALVEAVGIPVFKSGTDAAQEYDHLSYPEDTNWAHALDNNGAGATDKTIQALTVCFSTQVGCAMQCAFCATGGEGFTRNLSAGEMIDQVAFVEADFNARVSHVVSMGQGEPFLNYNATIEALDFLNSKQGLGIGARHITVSTCGIVSGIERLAANPHQYTLAVSLHSAIQSVRDVLMPRVANQPLPQLKLALQEYQSKTGRRVSFEYLMIDGLNDTEEALQALIEFSRGIMCHVNLIPLNAVEGALFKPSSKATIDHWKKVLTRVGIETTVRNSRGADIDGACGQLKNKLAKTN